MDIETVQEVVEAVIFASDSPVSLQRIRSIVEAKSDEAIIQAIDELNTMYQSSGRTFAIRKVAGGFQIVSRPEFAKWIKKLQKGTIRQRLSHASLEALSIIAFKQPVSRTEIAAIRGVHSDGVIRNLLERNLITLAGRAETVGKPLLYKTTEHFLTYFGINDISDLPDLKEIEQLLADRDVGTVVNVSNVEVSADADEVNVIEDKEISEDKDETKSVSG